MKGSFVNKIILYLKETFVLFNIVNKTIKI